MYKDKKELECGEDETTHGEDENTHGEDEATHGEDENTHGEDENRRKGNRSGEEESEYHHSRGHAGENPPICL